MVQTSQKSKKKAPTSKTATSKKTVAASKNTTSKAATNDSGEPQTSENTELYNAAEALNNLCDNVSQMDSVEPVANGNGVAHDDSEEETSSNVKSVKSQKGKATKNVPEKPVPSNRPKRNQKGKEIEMEKGNAVSDGESSQTKAESNSESSSSRKRKAGDDIETETKTEDSEEKPVVQSTKSRKKAVEPVQKDNPEVRNIKGKKNVNLKAKKLKGKESDMETDNVSDVEEASETNETAESSSESQKAEADENIESDTKAEDAKVKPTTQPSKSRKKKVVEPVKKDSPEVRKVTGKKKASPDTNVKAKKQKVLLSIPSLSSLTGKVFVVGANIAGQLGFNYDDVEQKKRPTLLELPYSIVDIAAGAMHSVCLTEGGEVLTFGCNDEGALGRVTDEDEYIPARVEIPERIVQISAGDSHSAALTASGHVYLWGNFRGGNGPMGLTADTKKQITPIRVLRDITVVKIASGAEHLACLSDEGIVYTCGCGEQGQLGRLSERVSGDGGRKGLAALVEPAAVSVKERIKTILIDDVWTGSYYTFLKAQDTGHIYAFGVNNYNQLGFENESENRTIQFIPKQVQSFNNRSWNKISGGMHHTLALDSAGLVYSLGRKEYGRLGLGENCDDKTVPTVIPTLANTKCTGISCGESVSLSTSEEGAVYSWGMGDTHQLGHGSEDDCHVPTAIGGNFSSSWKAYKVSGGGQHTLILAGPKESAKKDP